MAYPEVNISGVTSTSTPRAAAAAPIASSRRRLPATSRGPGRHCQAATRVVVAISSLSQVDRGELGEAVAGPGIIRVGGTTEVVRDAPDSVERRLDGSFRPPRHEGDVVARQEDAPLGGRQAVLHEVPVHAVVVAVVAGQRPLEGAEEVRV